MYFPAAGVECAWWIPPLVAFVVALVAAPAGLSGAFLLLPFQMSVLGFVSPAVTPTNLIFNTVSIPGGVYSYIRERRMVWPVAWAILLGTLPGVLIGAQLRLSYFPDSRVFKLFIAAVLLYMGIRLLRRHSETQRPGGRVVESSHASTNCIEYNFGGEQFSLNPWALVLLSVIVGIVGGIYGVGGGAIIAPYLMGILQLPAYTVAGAALLATLVTSIAGVAGFAALGQMPDWRLGLLFGAGGLAGSYVGARLQKRLPEPWIRTIVATLVIAIAVGYSVEFFL
jgi:uncharacterized protein